MSLLSKLFGGSSRSATKSDPEPETVEHEGCTITPTPIREEGGYRLSAKIEKLIEGEVKSHTLIRADIIQDITAANEAAIRKARQMIDEQGDRLFG